MGKKAAGKVQIPPAPAVAEDEQLDTDILVKVKIFDEQRTKAIKDLDHDCKLKMVNARHKSKEHRLHVDPFDSQRKEPDRVFEKCCRRQQCANALRR